MYSNKVDRPAGIHSDQIGKLVTPKALKDYPDKIRKITFYDVEQDRGFVFITNNFEIEAAEIALLYKKKMGGGTVLQMDKAAPTSQLILEYNDECCQNTGILCDHYLLSSSYCC